MSRRIAVARAPSARRPMRVRGDSRRRPGPARRPRRGPPSRGRRSGRPARGPRRAGSPRAVPAGDLAAEDLGARPPERVGARSIPSSRSPAGLSRTTRRSPSTWRMRSVAPSTIGAELVRARARAPRAAARRANATASSWRASWAIRSAVVVERAVRRRPDGEEHRAAPSPTARWPGRPESPPTQARPRVEVRRAASADAVGGRRRRRPAIRSSPARPAPPQPERAAGGAGQADELEQHGRRRARRRSRPTRPAG